jgi:tetratricopeptide (TPR) repeat protein
LQPKIFQVKRAQLITFLAGILIIAGLYFFGRTSPSDSERNKNTASAGTGEITIDSILVHAKESLRPEQVTRLGMLEQSVVRGNVKDQQLEVFHQLAHFWKDSAQLFEPYAWYEAESARLENSEKSLTFAAHLFLYNLRDESSPQLRKWKALQARDLFERSLKLNPNNDSSTIGLGACYIFGNIAENPMEGILKVKQVADRDSTNVFAQLILGHGSVISGQYDKAIERFQKVAGMQPDNLEAVMMLAEVNERMPDKPAAILWYRKAIPLVNNPELVSEIQKRIDELAENTSGENR